MLFVLFVIARRIVHSPFGLSLRSIKGNALRASAIGIPVDRRLIAIYTMAAFYAGVAGALLTQTTAFASLDVFSFDRSADLLLVLIIGGIGYLYGGLIGAVVFKLMQDWLANITPQYWQFWLGLVLVVDRADRPRAHGALGGAAARPRRRAERAHRATVRRRARPKAVSATVAPALETIGIGKNFGGIVAANDISLKLEQGARHALIGPNGAGKTTFINLLTGMLRPTGGRILLDGEDITTLAPFERVRRGIARTFQINQLFGDLTPLETIGLAVSERLGSGVGLVALAGQQAASHGRDRRDARSVPARATSCTSARQRSPYGRQRLLEIALACACKPRVLLLDEPAAGVPTSESAEILDTLAALAGRRERAADRARHGPRVPVRDRALRCWWTATLFAEGPPDEIARDPRVKAAYLGEAVHG